jgi:UDP-N-acetylmuramoyl-L-alanyl-D-glutamate--2,6-diaminopimelate ligase
VADPVANLPSMLLREVLARSGAAGLDDLPAIEVTALAYDHRTVGPGTIFFCVPGFTRDGHEFAADAARSGAAALVVEHAVDTEGIDVPQVHVPDVRAAMAPAAALLNGDPTARLRMIGITGTNGKTTSAFLMRDVLESAGVRTGMLGTIRAVIGGQEEPAVRTTPEAIDLQARFAAMLAAGDEACVMEVSSHALELGRADAIHWDVAIFTNLTQDHLDFHPTMEDYFAAKRVLFSGQHPGLPPPRVAIINIDDPYGARLASELERPITFALRAAGADYRGVELETGLEGSTFTVHTPDGPLSLRSPLRGEFNVYNVIGALAVARALDVSAETCVAAIATAGQVPGRFETVDEGQPFAVVVDYAHTPDSLENVLRAARGVTRSRLRVVFGCGGDRDRGKRPLMGEIARRLADDVFVTSDNPRSEDPEAIIDEILEGSGAEVAHDPDRHAAIARALESAQPGDVVVIAGKGHEQGQEFADGRKLPFDDVTVAREVLRGVVRA